MFWIRPRRLLSLVLVITTILFSVKDLVYVDVCAYLQINSLECVKEKNIKRFFKQNCVDFLTVASALCLAWSQTSMTARYFREEVRSIITTIVVVPRIIERIYRFECVIIEARHGMSNYVVYANGKASDQPV